jgi:hypothetical protein
MTWERGLEVVVARTRHERLRWLRSHDNPDVEQRDAYRRLMVEQAGGNPAAMPPARTQAASLWRSLRAFVTSGGKLAPKSVRATRQAACNACPFWNGFRCGRCGCTGLKVYAAVVSCPDSPPRWTAYVEKAS